MAEGTSPNLIYPFHTPPGHGTSREVVPGLRWVRMRLPFPPDHINLWLLADGAGWTVVDAGLARDEVKADWQTIFDTELGGRPVTRIIVTHFHPDHVGLADWLCTTWQAPLWMTAAEWYTARAVHAQGSPADIDTRLAFYRGNGADDALLGGPVAPNGFYRRGVPAVPPAFRRIDGDEAIRIGEHDWRPIIGRGHAPEHACLYCRELGILIAGDIVLPRITPNVSVWPTEPLANPLRDYLDSLERFSHLPDDTLVLPAHGLPFRGLHARIADIKTHHVHRLDRLEAAIAARPHNAVECFPMLFRREIGPDNVGLATGEALAHLHLLESQGRARRERGADGVWRFAAP
jgi:glyoxylase-like metal-dependent hydrolase (beta-lactamase superfamily II)